MYSWCALESSGSTYYLYMYCCSFSSIAGSLYSTIPLSTILRIVAESECWTQVNIDMDMRCLKLVFSDYAACKGMAERSPEFETEEVWDGTRWVLVRKTVLSTGTFTALVLPACVSGKMLFLTTTHAFCTSFILLVWTEFLFSVYATHVLIFCWYCIVADFNVRTLAAFESTPHYTSTALFREPAYFYMLMYISRITA